MFFKLSIGVLEVDVLGPNLVIRPSLLRPVLITGFRGKMIFEKSVSVVYR